MTNNNKVVNKGGRPPGSKSRNTQELLDRAKAGGLMPLDILLADMRLFYSLGEEKFAQFQFGEVMTPDDLEATKRDALLYKGIARDCAEKVSPYLHSKLATIDSRVTVSNQETALTELE